ncbi:MAG: hypothetical protein OEZ10_07050 [Gammaproteobacteria bacterium]|nr:hypothetical protein [Gammaproteobacteria bacterium]
MHQDIETLLCDLDELSGTMDEAITGRDWSRLSQLTYQARDICSAVVSVLHYQDGDEYTESTRLLLQGIIRKMETAESVCLDEQQEILLQAKPVAAKKNMNRVYSL